MNCVRRDSRVSIIKVLPVAVFVAVIATMMLVVASAQAQTYTVLHDFTGGLDGSSPHQLIQGSDGNFYGTARFGGANDLGNVFEMDPSGVLTVLYSFTGEADGCAPQGPVFRDSNGDLYGTTNQCADPKCRCGAFFKLDTNKILTVLHTFTRGSDGNGADGEFPSNNIVSVNGELYGTTEEGGSNRSGVLYKITKAGHYTVLQNFVGRGTGSQEDLTRDPSGNIYGEASGSIFELDTAGKFSTIYSFTGGVNDGGGPVGRLILDAAGTITGAAAYTPAPNPCGLIFRLESNGTVKALHHFGGAGGVSGCGPETGLVDMGGTIYGTTADGGDLTCANGNVNCGVLFQISKTGVYSVVHTFTGLDGGQIQDELTKGNDGSVYGVSKVGGTGPCEENYPFGCGVIFKYTQANPVEVNP